MVAAAALLVVTRRGVYVSPDSLFYVGAARSLVDGQGYSSPPGSPPISNFPPLYPLLLAGVAGALGADPLTVTRYVGPVLFAITVLVVGLVVQRVTGSLRLAVVAQLLVASGIDLLAYHSAALSEPLFLLLALLALVAVAASLRWRGTWLVFVAGLLAGLATITRFLGLAVVLAGAAAFLVLGGRRRWKSVVAFSFVSLAPLATWLTWLSGAEGRVSNRRPVLHAPDGDYFLDGLTSATTWVLPEDVPTPARAAAAGLVLLILVVTALRGRRARSGDPSDPAPGSGSDRGGDAAPGTGTVRVLALFALAYLLALLADRWLFDVTGRLDDRFLLPVHVVAVVLALRVITSATGTLPSAARLGLSAVVGLQLAAGAFWLYDASTDPSVRPGGFTAPAWHNASVIEYVRGLPPSAAVFTNQVDALWFHTGRAASPIPETNAFLTGEVNPDFQSELDTLRARLGADGVVLYFTAPPARGAFLPPPDELAARLDLETLMGDEVGVVYTARGP